MRYRAVRPLPLLLGIVICCLGLGCSNSERIDNEVVAFWDIEEDATPLSTELNYLPIDDSEYPYAGIPRIVIETENHREIKDRETEIPAKLQVWGADAPESEVMELTIRGRGNTSWTDMPKNSYKIEFVNKQNILGMPKDRDWALIANYADKTLMKNYLAYHLSAELGAYYAPRCEFIELYLNKEYLGVYLLTETIKISKHRINIPETDNSYIVEVDKKYKYSETIFYSYVINDSTGLSFRVHKPQKVSTKALNTIEKHITDFETYLTNIHEQRDNNIAQWLDVEEYIKYYWVEEFAKNPDANFFTSVFFSWEKNNPIKMGPVWDFDLAFGEFDYASFNTPSDWHIKTSHWNKFVFQDTLMVNKRESFWIEHKSTFFKTINTIDSIYKKIEKAAANNFRKWPILSSTENHWHFYAYSSYEEAIIHLKDWINQRYIWINTHLVN
jgi:hypothetical protein